MDWPCVETVGRSGANLRRRCGRRGSWGGCTGWESAAGAGEAICPAGRGREGKVRCVGVEENAGIRSQHAGLSSSAATPSNSASGAPPTPCVQTPSTPTTSTYCRIWASCSRATPTTAPCHPRPHGCRRGPLGGRQAGPEGPLLLASGPLAHGTLSRRRVVRHGGAGQARRRCQSSSAVRRLRANDWRLTPGRYVGVAPRRRTSTSRP